MNARLVPSLALVAGLVLHDPSCAAESLWIEAEHLQGVTGFCWPMGRPEMQKTAGHWGLSGPGWAAEWNQGGESGFLSIATAADDDRATASKTVEIPVAGDWHLWVRYGDWRETAERFQVRIEQPGRPAWTGRFGERAIVEEDNVAKLYWNWSFAWDRQSVSLVPGPATIHLVSSTKDARPRQVDVLVLTTDAGYRPRVKERPARESWRVLDGYRGGVPELEPLARGAAPAELPTAWKLRTFRDRGFLYLWNMNTTQAQATWLSDRPDRVPVPYHVGDDKTRAEFEKKYAGRRDVPIFADPRIVPTFHGVGAGIFATEGKPDAKSGEVNAAGRAFAKWLDANPDRAWAMMMNYHGGAPIGDAGQELFRKYRDRYVGSISGESLGYFYPPADKMKQATAAAKTRRELVAAFSPLSLESNAAKYRAVYGRDLDPNPYADVIACLSVGNIVFAPLGFDWGARTMGYESAAIPASLLSMRWAFLRGLARQHGGLTATYRSCNFGDSATIFSNTGSYHTPQNILDNYYSVYSGAGMTWYKFDLWYQYMAGSSMFYHEQGFDEFWQPGGTSAAGLQEVQLSPKGKLVDRFLRVTAKHPDRGHPFTPVAILVDAAHGWEPAPYWPNSFKNWHQHTDRFLYGDHEKMLEEYFWTAFHPIGPETERPMTATNEVYVPGVFGDLFDVVCSYPEAKHAATLSTYPVTIVAGEIDLTAAEGRRLAEYVERGGTLLIADAHLTGPGLAALNLPATEPSRVADGYRWLNDAAVQPSPRFRYRPIPPGGRVLATTTNGDTCCAAWDRGQGRLIWLSIPHGLSITKQAVPLVPRLIAHLTRGLMPVTVTGDVEWLVNRTERGWAVTLLNPAGDLKPQQGLFPTDFREARRITIRSRTPIRAARDILLPDDVLTVRDGAVECEVQAGGARIIELE